MQFSRRKVTRHATRVKAILARRLPGAGADGHHDAGGELRVVAEIVRIRHDADKDDVVAEAKPEVLLEAGGDTFRPGHADGVEQVERGQAEEPHAEAGRQRNRVRRMDEGQAVAAKGGDVERIEGAAAAEQRPALSWQAVGPGERSLEVK